MPELIPHNLVTLDGRLFVHWLNPLMLDLRPGFFHKAIRALPARHRFAALTPLESLMNAVFPAAAPGGFIFHTSRCGSTLLCQMLKQHPEAMVLGEPALLNRIVLTPRLSRRQKICALRSSIGLYCAWARRNSRRLFIKLSSWNLLKLDLYRQASNSPILYLYRHYLPVLASLLRKPPGWLIRTVHEITPPFCFIESRSRSIPPDIVAKTRRRPTMPSLAATLPFPSDDLLTRAGYYYQSYIASIHQALNRDCAAGALEYESILSHTEALLAFFKLPITDRVIEDMAGAAHLDAKSGDTYIPRKAESETEQLQSTLQKNVPELIKRLAAGYTALQNHRKQLLGP